MSGPGPSSVEVQLQKRLRVLSNATKTFATASRSIDRVLEALVHEVAETLECACLLNLVADDDEHFTTTRLHAADPELERECGKLLGGEPKRIDAYRGMNHAVRTQTPFVVSRVAVDEAPARAEPRVPRWMHETRLKTGLVVPIVVDGRVTATLGLMRSGEDSRPLDENDRMLVQSLAEHASLAIVTARLFEESERANEALRQSEEAHRLLFEASPLPLFVFDVETLSPLAVNEAALRLYGYHHDEFMGLAVSDLATMGHDAARARLATMGEAQSTGTWRYRRKDGSTFIGEATTRALTFARHRARIIVIKDVTSSHEAEQTRALLAAIVESSNDAIISKALDGTITSWNAAAESLFGYAAKEAIGKPITLIVPEDRLDEERALLARVAAGDRIDQYETVRRRKDATEVAVSVSLAPVRDAAGNVVGASKTARDLTAQRRTEDAVVVAEKRFRALFDSGVLGIIVARTDGTLCDANDTFLAMLGYSREDLDAGRLNWKTLTPQEWAPWGVETVEELRRTGRSKPREKEYLRKDGTRVPVLVGVANVEGDLTIAVSVDLTERKQAEARADLEQARFRALVENSADGITLTAEDGRLAYVSPAAARIFGRTPDELTDAPFIDFIHPDDRAAASQDMQRARQADGVMSTTVSRVRRSDGTSRWVEITRTNRLLHAAVAGIVGNLRDITDRKLAEDALAAAKHASESLEAQLRQAQKMEAVGRLAGGIAHDFNNVLTVILSYAEMLLEDLKDGGPMRDDIDEIRKAGLRAAELTRQLLMFSRQQAVEPKVLDLNELLAGVDKMFRRVVGADVDIGLVHARPLGRVRVDPGSMEQVLMNLVVNARDAMPKGGRLTLETANVVLDEAYARAHHGVTVGAYVMVSVTDTGTGIDAATLPRIFDPFFTTKGVGKGTGLGLASVFGMVHQSGGTVSASSEVGRGTSFKIYLPRVDAATDPIRASIAPTSLRGTETILLVEDDERVRVVAQEILRKAGYHVIEAQSAGDALLLVEEHAATIHLLLTDVVMPHMSGPALARQLATVHPEIKVLCMSGYTDDSAVRHGVIESHMSFIQKPITPESLTLKVREVLDAAGGSHGASQAPDARTG